MAALVILGETEQAGRSLTSLLLLRRYDKKCLTLIGIESKEFWYVFLFHRAVFPFSPSLTSASPHSHPQHQEPFLSKKVTFFVRQVSGLWGEGGGVKAAIIPAKPDVGKGKEEEEKRKEKMDRVDLPSCPKAAPVSTLLLF